MREVYLDTQDLAEARAMGLKPLEWERVLALLGRRPNLTELGMFAVMWSEHCSYKHSKIALRQFPTTGARVIQGPGENAGVVDIGDGQAVVFKMESHNHPSAIEPYQGAATGVGGIVRDIFTMGARPIALLNSLRFGELTTPKQRYLFSGVVAGIAGYGNCMGIPTVGGEVYFNASYTHNCLVNAMCVGIIDQAKLTKGRAQGVGSRLVLIGARTGRDGIHGATFASEELSEKSLEKRPAVQVGDPFMEKLLLEACLELIEAEVILGMQDLGAAGLTSAASEMAARGGQGVEIDVSLVPCREKNMNPYEIMLSESQERMLLVVEPSKVAVVLSTCAKWGLMGTDIGRVTTSGQVTIRQGERVVAEVPAKPLASEGPVYNPTATMPLWQAEVQSLNLAELPLPEDLNAVLRVLLASPNIASKEWVYRQYDHMVRGDTVVLPGGDAAVLRIKGAEKGLALSVDCNSRYVFLDPYWGGAIAVAEAARNVACSGARPLAITNCLNFGSPERPEIFYQLTNAIAGMSAACTALGTPVTGGNVSLYNETGGQAVFPTPTVGMVGLLDKVEQRVTVSFKQLGDVVCLLGETYEELGGSEYLKVVHSLERGHPPRLDLGAERRLQDYLVAARAEGLLASAHDCSDGGLAVTLAESAIAGELGAEIELVGLHGMRPDALLFGESQSRVVVTVKPQDVGRAETLAATLGVPFAVVGKVQGDTLNVDVQGKRLIAAAVVSMSQLWKGSLTCLMSQ